VPRDRRALARAVEQGLQRVADERFSCSGARLAHNGRSMIRALAPIALSALRPLFTAAIVAAALAGCATRAVDVRPPSADPAEFAGWTCSRIDDELDAVQQRAADIAYAVDEGTGSNILALGVGMTVFWPALLASRPNGLEAADLARLQGRYEALRTAATARSCPPPGAAAPVAAAATLPLSVGDRLVYEDRAAARLPPSAWTLRVTALQSTEMAFELETAPRGAWRQDRAGNVLDAPGGSLQWQRLLRDELALGQVVAGDMIVAGDPLSRARLRGQVVAVGPQTVAEHRFDVAVIELFGDAPRSEAYTRVDGAIVVDRHSGVLLRLDLRSAHPSFALRRRLMRIEVAPR